jgi:hypothetical protein
MWLCEINMNQAQVRKRSEMTELLSGCLLLGPVQGRPVNGFVPVDRFRFGVDGETGSSRPGATVFPLSAGLTVFPLSSGLLVFCAGDTVVVKVRTRTLRPTSSRPIYGQG